jgi:hypothetical protein
MIAFNDGGWRLATNHWLMAKYEMPDSPILPLHHGCAAAHSMAS